VLACGYFKEFCGRVLAGFYSDLYLITGLQFSVYWKLNQKHSIKAIGHQTRYLPPPDNQRARPNGRNPKPLFPHGTTNIHNPLQAGHPDSGHPEPLLPSFDRLDLEKCVGLASDQGGELHLLVGGLGEGGFVQGCGGGP
jgi:hypothetical protein